MYFMLLFIASAIGLTIYTIMIYNKLLPHRKMAEESWRVIDLQLKRRAGLTPHLLEAAKGYLQHEKEVVEALKKVRTHIQRSQRTQKYSTDEVKKRIEVEMQLSKALDALLLASEKYPDLKTNMPFVNLQKNLGALEAEIETLRENYNTAAGEINLLVETFPSSLVTRVFELQKLDYFK